MLLSVAAADYPQALARWTETVARVFPTEYEILDLTALADLSVAFRWLWSARLGGTADEVDHAIGVYSRAAILSLIN
jgi:hypothetical protein